MQIDTKMIQPQTLEQLRFCRAQRNSVTGETESDIGNRSLGRMIGNCEARHVMRYMYGGPFDTNLQENVLFDLIAPSNLYREGKRKRSGIGLERRIGPISVILGFKDVTAETDLGLDAVRWIPGQCSQILERLMRRNKAR